MATTTADEFMDATLDVWELPPESATRVGHPAPFPVELPQRLIDLYTYEGDVVLDPFMGSGTTAVAAVRTGRHYLGYDTDDAYAKAARERVAAEVAAVLATPPRRPPGQGGRRRRGTLLVEAGFTLADAKVTKRRRFAGGLQADWIATDATGDEWLVLVAARARSPAAACGAPTSCSARSARPAVLTTAGHRVLVLTTDLPARAPPPLTALRDARGVAARRRHRARRPPARPSASPPTPPAARRARSATCCPA